MDLSTLASSKEKAKSVSHVPCKFYRQGSCAAGDKCDFSHDLAPGTTKPTCQWFAKGNCKFGHKCALAHILPGQPMSYDRKNKRAAQTALREANAAAASAVAFSGSATVSSNSTTRLAGAPLPQPSSTVSAPAAPASESSPPFVPLEPPSPPPPARPPPQQSGIARSLANSQELARPVATDSAPSPTVTSSSSTSGLTQTFRRLSPGPVVPPHPSSSSYSSPPTNSPISSSAAPMGPSTTSSIFSTSPFSSGQGGRSLFLPTTSAAVAATSSSEESQSSPGSLSHSPRFPPSPATTEPTSDPDRSYSQIHGDDDDGDADLDLEEATFLPSSLSDLLTPAELRRRQLAPGSPSTSFLSSSSPATAPFTFSSSSSYSSVVVSGPSAISPPQRTAQFLLRRPYSSSFVDTTATSRLASSPLANTPPSYARLNLHTSSDMSKLNGGGSGGTLGSSLPKGLAAGLSTLHLQPAHSPTSSFLGSPPNSHSVWGPTSGTPTTATPDPGVGSNSALGANGNRNVAGSPNPAAASFFPPSSSSPASSDSSIMTSLARSNRQHANGFVSPATAWTMAAAAAVTNSSQVDRKDAMGVPSSMSGLSQHLYTQTPSSLFSQHQQQGPPHPSQHQHGSLSQQQLNQHEYHHHQQLQHHHLHQQSQDPQQHLLHHPHQQQHSSSFPRQEHHHQPQPHMSHSRPLQPTLPSHLSQQAMVHPEDEGEELMFELL